MKRFVEGEDRNQVTLLPECLDDYIEAENPVRVIEVFVDEHDLGELGFVGVEPLATGRPSYHPAVLLKIYICGYLNRIQSSRRLEREAQRNVELMWLTGRLRPDFKTVANFRKDNGRAIRKVCRQFVVLCQKLDLFAQAVVAIVGSKYKAVNNRDGNSTCHGQSSRQIEDARRRFPARLDIERERGRRGPSAHPAGRVLPTRRLLLSRIERGAKVGGHGRVRIDAERPAGARVRPTPRPYPPGPMVLRVSDRVRRRS